MKHLLILNLLFPFLVAAQVDRVQIQKEKKTAYFASIAGYFDGKMNYSLLCDTNGLVCSKEYEIEQFVLNYSDKIITLKGHIIPDSICVDIGSCCIQSMVFFTGMTARNKNGDRIVVLPLNLIITRNEE